MMSTDVSQVGVTLFPCWKCFYNCFFFAFLTEDPEACHWTVDRRYHDFYTLESKLTEFHGEFTDTQLPPKRILFGPRGVEFMESKRQVVHYHEI